MSAGRRSFLAPWMGGAWVAPPPPSIPSKLGYRGLLAPWMGGVSTSPIITSTVEVGYHSLLAFWMGGAGFLTTETGRAGSWSSHVGYWVGGLNGFTGNTIPGESLVGSAGQITKQYRVERASSWQGGAD